jgi:uncharacterized protein (DUF58 family)
MQAVDSAVAVGLPRPLDLRRVYIVPTGQGLLLGGLIVVILLGAINYDNALAYLLCFLLGGLFLVAMLHTYRNLAGLAFDGAHANDVFAGEAARFVLHFTGVPARSRYAIQVATLRPRTAGVWGKRPPGVTVGVAEVASEANVELRVPSTRRGRLGLGRLRVESVFPLGLLRAWAYFDSDAECDVYPAPYGRLPLPRAPSAAAASTIGRAAGLEDFAALQPYRWGESLRAIHWRTYAKRDELLSKRFQGGGEGEVILRWRELASLPDDELRLAQLAQWALAAEQSGLRYALELPGTKIESGRGAAHCARVLRALARYPTG